MYKLAADLVTETDKAVEHMVWETLKQKYPTFWYEFLPKQEISPLKEYLLTSAYALAALYSFLGEESYKPGTRLSDSPTFICDPIDG